MRNIRNHTRTSVIKVKFSKAVNGVCKLYSSLQRKLAERFENDDSVETFEVNVKVDELPIDGTFTTDLLVKFKDIWSWNISNVGILNYSNSKKEKSII